MLKIRNLSHYYFWFLVVVALILTGFGLLIIRAGYNQWIQTLWHACQSGFQNLLEHRALTWQLIILILIFVVIIRGCWSIVEQMWNTQQLVRLFFPLRETPPARLRGLLESQGLPAESIVFLNLTTNHAFCLGFWQPRIWLTAGLVNLLTDEELTAVLAHEAYHYRHRDPLRLLIARALRAAFFFLPLIGNLAKAIELQQETEADQSSIWHLGDDLPLLSALQKLLSQEISGKAFPRAAYSPFNVTEARLRRLIYPAQYTPFHWRDTLVNWVISIGMVMFLNGIGLLSAQPVNQHQEITACVIEETTNPLQTQLPLPQY